MERGVLMTERGRGFCTTWSPLAARRRRVGPSCSAIPPVGWWWGCGAGPRGL